MSEIILKRILAFLIDGAIVTISLQIVSLPLWNYVLNNYPEGLLYIAFVFQLVPFLLYYFISECFFSRTVGKRIMKLKISVEGEKFTSILIRTISRIIPFDPITFLFFKDKLLHDYLSKTKVVSDQG